MKFLSKQKRTNLDISSRDKRFNSIAKTAPSGSAAKATERTEYRMPLGYIDSKALVNIDIICDSLAGMSTDEITSHSIANEGNGQNVEGSAAFAKCFNYWAKDKGPLYCIKEELAAALLETDILEKKGILKDLPVALPEFLIAIPQNLIRVFSNDSVDFLLISCYMNENEGRTILISSITINSDLLLWNIQISKEGEIANKENIKNNDSSHEIILFTLNILLLLGTAGNFFISNVLPSQAADRPAETKGFNRKILQQLPKYPRWIGENYQTKTERLSRTDSQGTHSSPRTHWRRGHWRCIEPGEGKKWKESKRLWIEPVLINAGIE